MNKPTFGVRWPGYFAIALLLMLPLAILTVRAGNWQQGLLLYAVTCLLSSILLLWFLLALVLPRFRAQRSAIALRALPAVPGALLLAMALSARGVPPIHDITTDPVDPPKFSAVLAQRDAGANDLAIVPEVIEKQLEAYPDITTLASERSPDATFELAERIARSLGWEVINADRNAGIIEAVETTAVMAFKDDIVIRISSNAEGTAVDLRSASRVGISDLGANAERIRKFREAFRAAG